MSVSVPGMFSHCRGMIEKSTVCEEEQFPHSFLGIPCIANTDFCYNIMGDQ